MTDTTKTFHVPSDSELAGLLEEADRTPFRLERNGVLYRVTRDEEDPWVNYDPEVVRSGMEAAAGALTAEQAAKLKDLIYRVRENGSRPADRP